MPKPLFFGVLALVTVAAVYLARASSPAKAAPSAARACCSQPASRSALLTAPRP